jgi:quercetin dioxygenase-like cupin family protein
MRKTLAAGAVALGFVFLSSSPFAADAGYVPPRTILQQADVPGSNYTVIMAVTEIAPNMTAARHTHAGIEISWMLEGAADFVVEGIGTKHIKAGESFRLESGVKHSVVNGPATTKILAIYTIPKGAPLSTPAPE